MYEPPHLKENQYPPVILCAIQPVKKLYYFPHKDQQQIRQIISNKTHLQTLLKHIHDKFLDQGLLYTLVHKIYECPNEQIQYYVPELVYMSIKKHCKPIKKLLIYKASNSQSLRRLILWNVKAFTVLMKQKDIQIRRSIEQFQENLTITAKNKSKFTHSQKAISMITTASLILKKMPPENLKAKLQKFIKRFNTQYLNNLQHTIIIPFRKGEGDKTYSNYVVRIIQDDCSCFPTRKRVPYRIILQTIDPMDLLNHSPNEAFDNQQKVAPDEQRDLFDQVTESVSQRYGHLKLKSFVGSIDNRYPFVIDTQENLKISQLTKFAKKIEKQQKLEKEKQKDNNLVRSKLKNSFILRKNTVRSNNSTDLKSFNKFKDKYQVLQNQNLKKFQATYIPTLPSTMRKSANHLNSMDQFSDKKNINKLRWSSNYQSTLNNKQEQNNVKIVQEETKWVAPTQENVFGLPWQSKVKKYKQASFFKNFPSLRFRNVVVKGGDDLRQQIICMQLIYKMRDIVKSAKVDVFIKPYQIIVLSENSGILEFVSNSISIDGMKKSQDLSISQFYCQVFETESKFNTAKQNFIRSLVGSSILTYILKLKDRHNGNILLDNQGNVIHIDFGFILGMSPGGLNFQSSPFKFTEEYVDLIGDKESQDYRYFQDLFCEGMRVIRNRSDQLCLILQIMMEESDLECFKDFKIQSFKQRFKPSYSQEKFKQHCLNLIQKSCMNSRTVHYDFFQYYTNGINP